MRRSIFLMIIISLFSYMDLFSKDEAMAYIEEILLSIKSIKYDESSELLEKYKEKIPQELHKELCNLHTFISQVGILKKNEEFTSYKPAIISSNNLLNSIKYLNHGLYKYYYKENEDSEAISYFEVALEFSKKIELKSIQNEIYKAILEYHTRYFSIYDTVYQETLNSLRNNTQDNVDILISDYYDLFFIRRNNNQQFENVTDLKRCIKLLNTEIPNFYKGNLSKHIAIHYEYVKDFEKSLYYYKKAKEYYGDNSLGKFIEKKIALDISIAILKNKMGLHMESNNLLNIIDKTNLKGKLIKWNLTYLDYWKAKNFEKLNISDSAYYFLSKSFFSNMEFNQKKHINNITQLNVKFRTAEKEKQILIEQQKKKKNQNIAATLGGSLFLGIIIAILIYRNTKRKQHIAEQEREIEIQKTEKLLKEQELTAIDAMISGQEKERQRLANDLHDNIGSTLATVKLHFDHLKNNHNNPNVENIEELYIKTNNLLDEAYQKVRTIAHEKNSGVMAKKGLLPAVRNLAKKASNGNRLQIEVQDYGLDERLDNALEISIFRIIQELITNTIKHANASEINISLTNHDSLLNIIVEDNGKGFNAKILPEKDGMGLKSIEKRIEHLEGTFEIDSTIGKGTNIIINIPI
ncbi:sensor histidine kinase [Aquimarina sp. M1]